MKIVLWTISTLVGIGAIFLMAFIRIKYYYSPVSSYDLTLSDPLTPIAFVMGVVAVACYALSTRK